jgi:hypothetical protein
MDAAIPTVRRLESPLHAVSLASDAQRTLKVSAEYRLSEAGRKASLLSGGNGRARQKVTLMLPATRLHLVRVEANGVARLKLRPQFQLSSDQRIVRVAERPLYDHPPTLDELLQDAARNHELERGFYGQKTTTRATRREAYREWLEEAAREFLADAARRAIVHPAPTARRCQLATSRGPISFHATHMTGLARQVPLEAFRRFQNDLRIRNGQAAMQREHDVVVNGERRHAMEEWVAAHGTPDQRERFAAGMLPRSEWLAAVADSTFAPLAPLSIYDSDGAPCLQGFLRQLPAYVSVVVTKADYRVITRVLPTATQVQWDWLQWIRRAIPHANVHLRERELVWTRDASAPRHRTNTILVTTKVGCLTLRREFVMPDSAPPVSERTKEDVCPMA